MSAIRSYAGDDASAIGSVERRTHFLESRREADGIARLMRERDAAARADISRRCRRPYVRFVKPIFDRVVASVLFVVLAPLLIALAVAVRVRMGRDLLYRQPRVGRHGTVFTIVKFRTMLPDRRRAQLPFVGPDRRRCHKSCDDPRHTRLGRALRASSLDELPQLINVIRGEMSLVGPRPELVDVVRRENLLHHPRHALKPGMTGLWQVSGSRNLGILYGLDLDLEYVRRVSFSEDMRILCRTVGVVLARNGC